MAFIENPATSEIEKCKYFFVYKDKSIFLKKENQLLSLSDFQKLKDTNSYNLFFVEPENQLCVLNLEENAANTTDYTEITIREFFGINNQQMNTVVSRGHTIICWLLQNKFCPRCGSKLVNTIKFSSRTCPECKNEYFPRIEPCVIVLVKREDKFLLVRHTYRNQNLFACIAGFIEAGESVEQAVVREVKEEVGIDIKNVVYKGSQGWPFPDQLMLAFTAEYAGGELKLQEEEIAEAKWVTKDELPQLTSPKKGAVAWRLIHDDF